MRPKEHIQLSLWLRFEAKNNSQTIESREKERRDDKQLFTSAALQKISYCPRKVARTMLTLEALFARVQISDTLETRERTHAERTYPPGLQQVLCFQDQKRRAVFQTWLHPGERGRACPGHRLFPVSHPILTPHPPHLLLSQTPDQ